MKKVILVTWNGSANYGTNLQAFALYTKIRSMGYDCYMLSPFNYCRLNLVGYVRRLVRLILNAIKSGLLRRRSQCEVNPLKMERIREFVENSFIYHPKVRTRGQYRSLLATTHCFLTGSDQIWNGYNNFLPFYFLDFADGSATKASYASSIGTADIPADYLSQYKELLLRFDHLAMREKQGAKAVGDLIGRDVRWVLDPTFLLSSTEWSAFSEQAQPIDGVGDEPYIFCYFVGDNPDYWKKVDAIKKKLEILRTVIVPLEKEHFNSEGLIVDSAGPHEFVWLLENASYVCTDSFHATALCINFKKEFSEFIRFEDGDARSQNSRIYELLERYGLSDRIHSVEKVEVCSSIDYDTVYSSMVEDRADSVAYLKGVLR